MKRQIVMCTFALAAIVGPAFDPTVGEARSRQVDGGESQVQANGITIAYRSYGSADRETILLIMGVGGQLTEWPAIFAALGAGKSAKVAYSLEDMASDAVGLLGALGIRRAHLAGASMGGMIAVDASRDVAANIPGAELRVIPNMGHNLPGSLVPVIADAIVSAATRARHSAQAGSPR